MKSALKWLKRATPFLRLGADELADLDEDEIGTDDRIAKWITYIADVVDAIIARRPIPLPVGLFTEDEIGELAVAAKKEPAPAG